MAVASRHLFFRLEGNTIASTGKLARVGSRACMTRHV
jgi:hypothetical protein